MIGLPGSGKTTFAERFADTFSAPFLNAQSLQAGDAAADVAASLIDELLKTNQTIIYEGVAGSRAERSAIAKKAREKGYEPLLVWVQTDPAAAEQRVTKSTKKTAARMSTEEFERAKKHFTPPNDSEKTVVLSGMHTYASQAKTVLRRLSADNPRPEGVPARTVVGRRVSIQ